MPVCLPACRFVCPSAVLLPACSFLPFYIWHICLRVCVPELFIIQHNLSSLLQTYFIFIILIVIPSIPTTIAGGKTILVVFKYLSRSLLWKGMGAGGVTPPT
jgi:hypothetical protein